MHRNQKFNFRAGTKKWTNGKEHTRARPGRPPPNPEYRSQSENRQSGRSLTPNAGCPGTALVLRENSRWPPAALHLSGPSQNAPFLFILCKLTHSSSQGILNRLLSREGAEWAGGQVRTVLRAPAPGPSCCPAPRWRSVSAPGTPHSSSPLPLPTDDTAPEELVSTSSPLSLSEGKARSQRLSHVLRLQGDGQGPLGHEARGPSPRPRPALPWPGDPPRQATWATALGDSRHQAAPAPTQRAGR